MNARHSPHPPAPSPLQHLTPRPPLHTVERGNIPRGEVVTGVFNLVGERSLFGNSRLAASVTGEGSIASSGEVTHLTVTQPDAPSSESPR